MEAKPESSQTFQSDEERDLEHEGVDVDMTMGKGGEKVGGDRLRFSARSRTATFEPKPNRLGDKVQRSPPKHTRLVALCKRAIKPCAVTFIKGL
jgi:hypothetical protein